MGEVYRAADARLSREVAIKMLPADFANDADRLKRFEQEARATSALNHPNILTVYDIGAHDGQPFIVEELSDIFSFGVILYEMLSGRRTFGGDSAIEVMNSILKEEPPELSETNAKISPALDKIVRRCLEKKPERRFQSASDMGFALEALSSAGYARALAGESGQNAPSLPMDASSSPHAGARAYPGWRERIWMISAGVFGLALLAMTMAYFQRPASDARPVRLSFTPPESVAFNNWRNDYVVVSPDGQKLLFTGRSADGKRRLHVRLLDAIEATPLPETDDAVDPFWSPDSRSIGFAAQGKLKRIDVAGGRPQALCNVSAMQGGAWGSAGVILFGTSTTGLLQIPEKGGEPVPATIREPGTSNHQDPVFLPDGRHFLYRVGRGGKELRTFAGSLDSKEVKQVLADGGPAVYAPPGWLLFIRNGALLAQAFDTERQELKGEALPLTKPTDIAEVVNRPFSVSENGVLIWQGDRLLEHQLVWFDRAGKQVGAVGPPNKVSLGEQPRLSPDGTRVVVHRSHPQTRNFDIWVIDLERENPIRVTSDPGLDLHPNWLADGSRVIFYSNRGGGGIYQRAATGAGDDELLLKGIRSPLDWSADGRFILITSIAEKTRLDIWVLPLLGERKAYPLLDTEFAEKHPQLSPDMRWLAYASDESGSLEIYVQSFSPEGKLGGNKKRISISGGEHPRFRRDGKELFYVAPDGQMMAVALQASGATFEFEPPKTLFKTRMLKTTVQVGIGYDVTRDGQRFLIGAQVGEPSPVSVILNWTELFKK